MILQIIKLHTLRLKGLSSTQLVPHTKFLEPMNLVVSLFNLVANILYQCLECSGCIKFSGAKIHPNASLTDTLSTSFQNAKMTLV